MNNQLKDHLSIVPGNPNAVKVQHKGDLSYAMRLWKSKLKDSGVLNKLKEKKEYIKPSAVKRKQREKVAYMNQFQNREQDE